MIDLDAYLRRLDYRGPREPGVALLRTLCASQPAHIPYENIDPLLGTPPSLEPAAVTEKLLHARRGGYCFEQNLLLKLALEALGFEVEALAARVVWMRPADAPLRPRSHMLLKVAVPQGQGTDTYIADAGFGGNLMDTPLPLVADEPQRTPHATLRFTLDGELYTAETRLPAGWTPMYRFTLEPHAAADYEPLNWFTATHPSSIFCHNLLMERVTPELRVGLFNDRLVQRRPDVPPVTTRLNSQPEFDAALEQHFQLELATEQRSALWAKLPKGLDQFVTP
ncbi:arylamine N-acetyltransferase [Piscinibacter sp. HJYY11]|uniref:arylamine N-acetyltransferase family protein n=1 Tax=Piscinibacter sp. HJYY11 TaxID=2801333 RepID=UPI00191D46C2|nr:arylamine N-acetyltransferase [Piscinibacter sp. HJYY11]MBL0727151.1 arylamine N-acetyltransferase [Piscinibacter sp. HJYY11]